MVFTAIKLNAALGLQLMDMQRLIMGGLHETVAPFVEQSQPQSIQELLQRPSALSTVTALAKAEITPQQQIATGRGLWHSWRPGTTIVKPVFTHTRALTRKTNGAIQVTTMRYRTLHTMWKLREATTDIGTHRPL